MNWDNDWGLSRVTCQAHTILGGTSNGYSLPWATTSYNLTGAPI